MPIATINNYTLGFSYTTFTWPSSPSWTSSGSWYYIDVTVSGIVGGSAPPVSNPIVTVLIPTAAKKDTLREAWNNVVYIECVANNTLRFYTLNTTACNALKGETIQVAGF